MLKLISRPTLFIMVLAALSLAATPQGLVQAKPQKEKNTRKPNTIVTAMPEADAIVPGISVTGLADESLPQRKFRVSLRELGASRPLVLRGVEGDASVNVSVRLDEVVESALLHMTYTLSPALLPGLSHIKIFLNDEVMQTIAVDKDKLGLPQTADLKIDPRFFIDYNRLRFQLIGHYSLECEFPLHSSLWGSISNESYLELSLRQLPLRNDLALLPAPFFDVRDNGPLTLPFVFARRPSFGLLKAAGSIASWMGSLAAYRGSNFPVFENQLPAQHAVVLASNDQRPDFLKDLPAVDKPTLTLIQHPTAPGIKLLLVLGKDDAQVQLAADTLALEKAALSGQSIQVRSLEYPARRAAYDAPRWITTQRPVQLAELVKNPNELQLRGTMLTNEIRINTRMAPDLFTWNAQGVPLDLMYRFTPPSQTINGSLNVSINDQFIKSYPLETADGSVGNVGSSANKGTIFLPLFDDGTIQTKSNLKIPAFLIGGDNQLQFAFQIPPADLGRCLSAQPSELHAAIDPQSTLDLTAFHHYVAMPNLAAFSNSGFPFTKYADLAETTIVLPDQASAADIELYLTALGRMGAATGYAGTRFRLLQASRLEQAGNTDILMISQANSSGIMAKWGRDLPALIEAGKRTVRPLEKALDSFMDLFNQDIDSQISTAEGRALLEGNGPLAALSGFESPLNKGRSVVLMEATDDATLKLIGKVLNDPGKLRNLRGDLSLFRGDAVESFRINPVFYVGDLPWWRRMWFHIHSHPLLLALLGMGAGLVLTSMAYVALRAMARRRLMNRSES